MLERIKTKEQVARQKRKNQIIIGVVMIGLLVLSTAGYSLFSGDSSQNSDSFEDMGFEFVRTGGYWSTNLGGQVATFQFLPLQLANVSIEGTYSFATYSNQPLYFVGGGNGPNEILNNLGNHVLRYQEACISNETCTGDFPIKDCDSNLIIFREAEETKVYQDKNCVYIEGDQVKGADAFLYKLFGVN